MQQMGKEGRAGGRIQGQTGCANTLHDSTETEVGDERTIQASSLYAHGAWKDVKTVDGSNGKQSYAQIIPTTFQPRGPTASKSRLSKYGSAHTTVRQSTYYINLTQITKFHSSAVA